MVDLHNLSNLFKWLKRRSPNDKVIKEAEIELAQLVRENEIMYACILEASQFESGSAARLRCVVELQRIARADLKNAQEAV